MEGKVCKIFHNEMENNKNSGNSCRLTLLGKMLHISLKLFCRVSLKKRNTTLIYWDFSHKVTLMGN